MRTTEDIYRYEILPKVIRNLPKDISKYRVSSEKEREVVEDYKFIMDSIRPLNIILNDERYLQIVDYYLDVDIVYDFEVIFPHGEDLIKELDSKYCSWSRFLYTVTHNKYSESEINTLIDLLLPSDRILEFKVTLRKVEVIENLDMDEANSELEDEYNYIGEAFPAHIINPILSLKSFCFLVLVKDVNKSNPKLYNILWDRMDDNERLSCFLYRRTIFRENRVNEARARFRKKYQIFTVDPTLLDVQIAKEANDILASHLDVRMFTYQITHLALYIIYSEDTRDE